MELAKQQEHTDEIRQDESLIRERLKVLREGESKLEPERKALGKALESYYETALADMEVQVSQKEDAKQEENDKFTELQDKAKWHEEQIIELMRHGKDDMEVAYVKDLTSSLVDPYLLENGLAVWA